MLAWLVNSKREHRLGFDLAKNSPAWVGFDIIFGPFQLSTSPLVPLLRTNTKRSGEARACFKKYLNYLEMKPVFDCVSTLEKK